MVNIAIDGPAGAGKSTVAKLIAKKFGYIYLDTGAMYRATAYFAIENKVEVTDEKAVEKLLESLEMDILFLKGEQQIIVCGKNVTPFLREHHMSKAASDISAIPAVRYKMVDLQREFAKKYNVVLDGRDIGTFVLPNAKIKIYLTASADERAKRRFLELKEKGQDVDFENLKADIIQRDYNDSHRAVAPLKQADDAVLLDTSNMTIEEVANAIEKIIKEKNMDEKKVTNEKVDNITKTKSEDKIPNTTKTSTAKKAANINKAIEKKAETTNVAKSENTDAAKKTANINNTIENEKKSEIPNSNTLKTENTDAAKKVLTDKKKSLKKVKENKFRMYRFLRFFAAPIIRALYPTTIINKENFDKITGGVLICNHYAAPDTLIPVAKLFKKELHVIGKKELFERPIAGKFMRAIGGIPVHRGEPDISATKAVLAVLKADKKFMIFPEGTRNREGTENMREFKQGAARFAIKTQKPILPMMYYKMHKPFKRNYLYIGEPLYLNEFYDSRTSEEYQNATDLVQEKMVEIRRLLNAYVENLKKKK